MKRPKSKAAAEAVVSKTVTRSPPRGLTPGPRRAPEVAAAIAAGQEAAGADIPPEIARDLEPEPAPEAPEPETPSDASGEINQEA